MVSTRNHPRAFPEPASPASRTGSSPPETPSSSAVATTTTAVTRRAASTTNVWAHTPSNTTLIWLAVSLPLVVWDTGYVLLRPHSMPGGWLHEPIWKPYALYGTVDYIYGKYAWDRHDGFTAAQGSLNVVETLGYMLYLYLVYTHGRELAAGSKGRGAPRAAAKSGSTVLQRLAAARRVEGRPAGAAVLVLFAMSVMTLSKTILYWLNEYFSGFAHIGHNKLWDLIFLWIIPNGAWIVVPAYMIYVSTAEILQGLAVASGEGKKRL